MDMVQAGELELVLSVGLHILSILNASESMILVRPTY